MELTELYALSREYDRRGVAADDPQTANACLTASVLLSLAYNILMLDQVRTSVSTYEIRAKRLRILEALDQEKGIGPDRITELVMQLNALEHEEAGEVPDDMGDWVLARKAGVSL